MIKSDGVFLAGQEQLLSAGKAERDGSFLIVSIVILLVSADMGVI
jgi:hypothetical protein